MKMFNGKHHKKSKKSMALLVSLVLLIGVVAGGTIAYMIASTGPVENTFKPSTVTTDIVEEIDGNVKENVKIVNTGDTDAWIRATIVITWKNEAGEVYGQKPVEDSDYIISYGNDWAQGADGFWYYKKPVPATPDDNKTDATGALIVSCEPKEGNSAPDGYYLNVEIIASGIQSKPANVFNTEWASSGLTVQDKDSSGNALDPTDWTLD